MDTPTIEEMIAAGHPPDEIIQRVHELHVAALTEREQAQIDACPWPEHGCEEEQDQFCRLLLTPTPSTLYNEPFIEVLISAATPGHKDLHLHLAQLVRRMAAANPGIYDVAARVAAEREEATQEIPQ